MSKIPLVCIIGPTASGKSDAAVEYALAHNGEVISADSRQVYTGLDIGTGKITPKEMKGVPHHLLDVADPHEKFNVGKFKKLAQTAIADIHARGKLPILCGGTGFYIDAVINNISYHHVETNLPLRAELAGKPASELFALLSKLDTAYAEALNHSEQNNTNRLIRAIEIATALGKVPPVKKEKSPYDITWIKIDPPLPELRERIHKRLINRINFGMIEEVANLHKNGLSWERMEELGLEYRYVSRFLRGILTKEKMISLLETEIIHYAKRQKVWFKKHA